MKYVKVLYRDRPRWGIINGDYINILQGNPYEDIIFCDATLSLSEATLLAPCDATKIVCVGKNYYDHAIEFGGPVPEEPIIFLKPTTSIIAPLQKIEYPSISQRVDYEGELAVVIKKEARKVIAKEANEYILGYTCLNDVTARDIQSFDGQWTRAKGFDTFCPIGPIVTDEIDPKNPLVIETRLNNQVKQKSTTDKMIWNLPYLLEFVTACMTLLPGDVLTTGTPANVGSMGPEDSVSVYIQGIGTLTNFVV